MSRSATPATRNEAMRRRKPPKLTPFAKLTIGTAIWPSRKRLRTVADGCGRLRTVAQRLPNTAIPPHTPRVKREPLLHIREKSVRPMWRAQAPQPPLHEHIVEGDAVHPKRQTIGDMDRQKIHGALPSLACRRAQVSVAEAPLWAKTARRVQTPANGNWKPPLLVSQRPHSDSSWICWLKSIQAPVKRRAS